jgi:hypothetical protein
MAHDLQESSIEQSDARWPEVAQTTSLVISSGALISSLIGAVWANGQRVEYYNRGGPGQMLHLLNGHGGADSYFSVYLISMFIAGSVALLLAVVGAKAGVATPVRAVVAGAMASSVLMIPVAVTTLYVISHWQLYD